MSLKRGITIIFGANILNMIFQVLTNFLLPKYLGVDCYAEIKAFQLVVSYSGVLHLGYVDGMYLKYGGKKIDETNRMALKTDLITFLMFQFALLCGLLTIAGSLKDTTLMFEVLAVFPLNITSCIALLFQATGEFESYARITNFTTILMFAVNICLLLVRCYSNYNLYLISYVGIDYIIMILCAARLKKLSTFSMKFEAVRFSISCLFSNIKNGFFLMLGNFSSSILTGMDRWFIKFLMDNTAFAMYSFAVSMESLMSVAVTPVSTTLYNYLCVHEDTITLKKIKRKIILFATAIVSCAFPAKFVLETFLTKYIGAASVIFYLFSAQIFYIVVKCYYVNLYKAQKRQKIYFIKLVTVIVLGFLLNAGLYTVIRAKEAFAIGTMFCGVVWYILSEMDFYLLRSTWKENAFLALTTASYLLLGVLTESLVGFVLYVMLLTIYSLIFMKKDVCDCIQIVVKLINKGKK